MIIDDRRANQGYTALELLVVMAIISLVFTTAVVYFHPFMKTAKTRTAASDMADLFRVARAAAVTSRGHCTLQIITEPTSDVYLGETPIALWGNLGNSFEDIKPPANCVVVYYSKSEHPYAYPFEVPLSPSELPSGENSVFVRWFTPLPNGVRFTNEMGQNVTDDEINGIRFVFDKYGAILWNVDPSTPTGVITGSKELRHNVIKMVEEDTSIEGDENQVVKYLVLIPSTGACRIMDYDEFWTYADDSGWLPW